MWPFFWWIGLLILVSVLPARAQDEKRCHVLCSPELKFEPTLTFEQFAARPRIVSFQNGQPADTTAISPEQVLEVVFALDVPTAIRHLGFTLEAIWTPFTKTGVNIFTGRAGGQLGRKINDNPVELEPEGSELNRYLVDKPKSAEGHTVADVEGLAIYHQSNSTGYLVASNQGNYTYTFYAREGENNYLTTFRVAGSDSVDVVTSDDSIEMINLNLSPVFSKGLMVAEDGQNTSPGNSGHDNYKLISWEQVAKETSLSVFGDIPWDPRQSGRK